MRIKRNNAVAVMIDIQEKLFPHIHNNSELLENILKLLKGIKVLHIPLLVTEQYPKGIGTTIAPLTELLTDDYKPIIKMAFSCCYSDDFMNSIKALGRKYVIIFGIETHVCVMQTAIDLFENGFIPVIIEDAVSSRKTSDKITALGRMKQEGAIIASYESILFELCEVSGTEEFKEISKIVK